RYCPRNPEACYNYCLRTGRPGGYCGGRSRITCFCFR
uniref:Tddefensin n=1 Tax=Tityus discrepans TaxID=57059 RepID=DEF_TITDI|nr:RecName: Full=Tddefensin [Tityus discrepans]